MANGIRVELSETALAASPGGAVTTRCTIYNASMIVDEYRLVITGVDPSWIEMPASTSRIFPEASETVSILFRPPRSGAVAAGDYPFTITGSSVDNPALTASGSGVLTIGPYVDFGFELDSPRQVTGEVEGVFTFQVTNAGNARLTIGFEAGEETGQLGFSWSEPQVALGAGETKPVTLSARPKEQSLGGGAHYQITVGASIVEVTPPMEVAAELRQRSAVVMFQTVPGVVEPPSLSPQSVELTGQTTQTEVVLSNRSAMPVVMALAGSDKAQALSFEFVGGDRVTVPPKEGLRVTIRITCLDRTRLSPPPAPTPFTITATPIDPAGEPRPVQGELLVPSPADCRLRLEPELVESTGPERVHLTVENVSNRAATFTIDATSKDAALTIAVGAAQVEVPAHDKVVVPVDLTPKADGVPQGAAARPSGYSIRVAPIDAPGRASEVSGQYVFAPAAISMRLQRKEIAAVGEATFDIEVENSGRGEVAVSLEASDRAAACTYTFDLPSVRINGRSTALVRLTVTPPAEHRPDARWQFEVLAKPTAPTGPAVRDEGVLIYTPATVTLALNPQERRGRRAREFKVMVTNPTSTAMTVRMTAVDRSGGLGVQLKKETIELPPTGRGSVAVPLRITPWKRMRGSGEAALTFNVAATPISPPGDAVTTEGRFVALPPWSKWVYLAILGVLVLALLFSPLYEQAFYAAGWDKNREWTEINPQGTVVQREKTGKHTFPDDISCAVRRVTGGEIGEITNICFAQGPKPTRTPESD